MRVFLTLVVLVSTWWVWLCVVGADALKEAQELGFAEADPTADVEGHDVQAKIALLAKVRCLRCCSLCRCWSFT